ncbi:DUF2865 domain-containing protein [Alsobacter sp. SYSU BS001988]
MKPITRMASLAAGLLGVLAMAGSAAAQQTYCDRLRADLAALDRSAGAAGQRQAIVEQIQRQRGELNRTIAYARSIGCQRQRFLIFGDPPPPECPSVEAKINSLEAGLAQLDAQAQRVGGGSLEAQRASLSAAYDANCRGAQPGAAASRQPGLFERLFGSPVDEVPAMPEDEPPQGPLDGGQQAAVNSGKTLCVRKCDGFYFPISQFASRGRFETDASLCQASCPNAEVELYVQPSGREADAAVSLAGSPYTALPNAFKYRKSFDPSCACRKDGQSWVEALANAEKIIGSRAGDVTVTEQQSQDMARPKEPAPPQLRGAAAPKPAAAPRPSSVAGAPGVDPSTLNPGAPAGPPAPQAPSRRAAPPAAAGQGGARSDALPPLGPPITLPPAGVPRGVLQN